MKTTLLVIAMFMSGICIFAQAPQVSAPRKYDSETVKTRSTSVSPDYVCLVPVIKAQADGGNGKSHTVFAFVQGKPNECESVVMISPLSKEDRDLLMKMSMIEMNTWSLIMDDEMRLMKGKERTWTPMIDMGLEDFRQLRGKFCLKHPDMFVYDLASDGKRTVPKPCTPGDPGRP